MSETLCLPICLDIIEINGLSLTGSKLSWGFADNQKNSNAVKFYIISS